MHFLRTGEKKNQEKSILESSEVAWNLLTFLKQKEMFPTVYSIVVCFLFFFSHKSNDTVS